MPQCPQNLLSASSAFPPQFVQNLRNTGSTIGAPESVVAAGAVTVIGFPLAPETTARSLVLPQCPMLAQFRESALTSESAAFWRRSSSVRGAAAGGPATLTAPLL